MSVIWIMLALISMGLLCFVGAYFLRRNIKNSTKYFTTNQKIAQNIILLVIVFIGLLFIYGSISTYNMNQQSTEQLARIALTDTNAIDILTDRADNGDKKAIETLTDIAFNSDDKQIKGRALMGILPIFQKYSNNELLENLKNNKTAYPASEVIIERGISGTENDLISALNKYGNKDMATYYLNSGNQKLETAAQSWGTQHGYTIESHPTTSNNKGGWGSGTYQT